MIGLLTYLAGVVTALLPVFWWIAIDKREEARRKAAYEAHMEPYWEANRAATERLRVSVEKMWNGGNK